MEAGRIRAQGQIVALEMLGGGLGATKKSVKGVEALGDAGEVAGITQKLPDGDGRRGMAPYLSGSNHVSKNGLPKDTHAKSFGEKVDSLEAEIAKLLGRMPKSLAERVPFKVGYVRHAGTNQRTPVLLKNENSPMFAKEDGFWGKRGGSGHRTEGMGNAPNKSDAEKMQRPYNHLVNVDGFKRGARPGISGGHNMESSYKALEEDASKYGLDVEKSIRSCSYMKLIFVSSMHYRISKRWKMIVSE